MVAARQARIERVMSEPHDSLLSPEAQQAQREIASARQVAGVAPGRPLLGLCPEGQERAELDDAEFWERVAAGPPGLSQDDDPMYDERPAVLALEVEPCRTCGEHGACSYDSEGRPLIHTDAFDDEETRDD